MSKDKCGDCSSFADGGCARMRESDILCCVPVVADTICPIGKFVAMPAPDLTLSESQDIIGLRKFGQLVGVSLASVQNAIDSGRITAVLFTKRGRKLIRADALDQWHATRIAGNNNRAGELPGDKELTLSSDSVSPNVLKTQYEAELARLRGVKLQLEIDEAESRLHDGAQITALWTAILSNFTTRMRSIPSTLAPQLAAIPDLSANVARSMLQDDIEDVLLDLAEAEFLPGINNGNRSASTD